MLKRIATAVVTAGVAAGLLLTPTVAAADGSQSAFLSPAGGGKAYVYKSWYAKNAAGQWDGNWYAELQEGYVYVRVSLDGVEVDPVTEYPGRGDSYDDVKVLRMKACNATRCTAWW